MRRNRVQVMYMPRDGKVNEMPNPKTAEEIFAEKDARIAELETELAALKEKYRWRRQSEEPAPMGKDVEVYSPVQERVFCYFSPRIVPSYWYWRPLDLRNLPEEDAE